MLIMCENTIFNLSQMQMLMKGQHEIIVSFASGLRPLISGLEPEQIDTIFTKIVNALAVEEDEGYLDLRPIINKMRSVEDVG